MVELPLKALVVDDEDLVRLTLVMILEEAGLEVLEASSGDEALRLLEQQPDVIVTDILMPGMNGWTVGEAARSKLPNIAVVYVSGHIGEELAAPVPGSVRLEKPFREAALLQAIEGSLETSRSDGPDLDHLS